ncbi:MAG: cytochrome P460 family protein [Rhodocyclales bacterium]|nr:cytochrome P460 family protein [Rhodocyclales bacterium]
MVKNAVKYAATGGWGFARWLGPEQKPYGKDARFVQECFGCHTPVKDRDWVFAHPVMLPYRSSATSVTDERRSRLRCRHRDSTFIAANIAQSGLRSALVEIRPAVHFDTHRVPLAGYPEHIADVSCFSPGTGLLLEVKPHAGDFDGGLVCCRREPEAGAIGADVVCRQRFRGRQRRAAR